MPKSNLEPHPLNSRLHSMLHLSVHERGGGAEAYLRFLEQGCRKWTTPEGKPTVSIASLQGLGAFPISPKTLPVALLRLRAFLHSRSEPVFFLYGLRAQLLGCLLAPRHKILVGMIHGEIDFEGRKETLRKLYERRINYWVANSEAVLDRENGCVIENALFDSSVGDGQQLNLSGPNKEFAYGVLASGSPLKGHAFLIDLWRKNPGLGRLCFAGNLTPDLVREAEAAGITCLGFVKPVEFFSRIRMLIHPSVSESMPNAIIESLGFGIPVLANPAGGIPSILGKLAPEMVLPRSQWKNVLGQLPTYAMQDHAQNLIPVIRQRFDLEPCFRALQDVCGAQLDQLNRRKRNG